MQGIRITRGEDRIANQITVTVHPRTTGTPGDVLWQANASIRLTSTTREVICRYKDPAQQAMRVGASSVIEPVAGTDYTVTDKADGTGTSYTSQVKVALDIAGASAAKLRLIRLSATPTTLYVHTLKLRGTPLRSLLPITATQTDESSFLTYGHRVMELDMPMQDDAGVAQDMATVMLANLKAPHPWIALTIDATTNALLFTHAFARDVGDRLHITDTSLALNSAACFIDALRHEITRGGPKGQADRHLITWRTTPADLSAYWVLGSVGYAELGSGAKLGY
jgi:hypothetical protein